MSRKGPFSEESLPGECWPGVGRATFANNVVRLIEGDFRRALFTKALYRVLMQKFSHIAHSNEEGFYGTWFVDDAKRLDWLKYVARGGAFGWADDPEEIAIIAWVKESGLIAAYEKRVADATERHERLTLARLQEKYGAEGGVA